MYDSECSPCLCLPEARTTMMTGATRNSVQHRLRGIVLILGILSQRLFSPIGSTGNMGTVPKSDRYRHRRIGIEIDFSRIERYQKGSTTTWI